MNNIIAVIVTYNRFKLLQETISAVRNQTLAPKQIVVINNGSTDGSAEWLDKQPDLTVISQENLGASGGFHTGIKKAVNLNCDWVWVMDDDTICNNDTLEVLVRKISQVPEKIGFIGSKCIWSDGFPHYMNIPAIKPSFNKKIPFNKYDKLNLLLVETTSWVSLLINTEAVRAIGLPYKEFFFWSDDLEYTGRITSAGYLGFYCTDSVVLHKTPSNYNPDFYRDTASNLWKHKYGFRNEFFLKKQHKGGLYFMFWLPAKVGYTSLKLMRIRNNQHMKFISTLLSSAWKSIFFNPKIDKV